MTWQSEFLFPFFIIIVYWAGTNCVIQCVCYHAPGQAKDIISAVRQLHYYAYEQSSLVVSKSLRNYNPHKEPNDPLLGLIIITRIWREDNPDGQRQLLAQTPVSIPILI